MLEDVMQASAPSHLVHSVKVSDLGQGRNPLRITSMRSLPDAPAASVEGVPDVDEDHVVRVIYR